MDFENEMTLAFPEKLVYDSSEINYDSKISDKTKRDSYFFRNNYSEEYSYGDYNKF